MGTPDGFPAWFDEQTAGMDDAAEEAFVLDTLRQARDRLDAFLTGQSYRDTNTGDDMAATPAENKSKGLHRCWPGSGCCDQVVTDPARDRIKTDPAVVATREAVAKARADFDRADERWRAAVTAQAAIRIRVSTGPTVLVDDVGLGVILPPKERAELARLAEIQQEADEARAAAHKRIVQGNEAVRVATIRAHNRITQTNQG